MSGNFCVVFWSHLLFSTLHARHKRNRIPHPAIALLGWSGAFAKLRTEFTPSLSPKFPTLPSTYGPAIPPGDEHGKWALL